MPTHLEHFKGSEAEWTKFSNTFPDLALSLDHRLRVFFPQLPVEACTDFLYFNYERAAEPCQSPVIVSQTLSMLIEQCYLTRQVPTFVQNTARVYNYAYTLDERDLVAEITVPQLEKYLEFTTHSLELCVRDAQSAYWQTPHEDLDSLTPQSWLSRFTLNLILSEATLRHEDRTLSPQAMSAINQVFSLPAQPSTPSTYGFYTLSLHGRALQPASLLHGVLVITTRELPRASADPLDTRIVQDQTPRTVVLYTPSTGLEAFTSLAALTQELSARLKDQGQREALLDCVLAEERSGALAYEKVDYSPVPEQQVKTFYSEQLIEKQKRDMRHAWASMRTDQPGATLEQLVEMVDQSLNSSMPIKPASLLRARYTRLLEIQLPEWLKTASDANKTKWRLAVERLNHVRAASEAPDTEPLAEIGQINTLLGYARTRLKQQIKTDHRIDIDPDTLFISTTEALQTGAVINPITGSGFAAGASVDRTGPTITYKTTRRSLSELALSNVGIWDVTFALTAQVKDAHGTPHPLLTSSYLKTLVRQLDIGQSYKARLNHLLVNSAQARWRKEHYVALRAAQLNLDLLEASMAGTLGAEQAAWVQAALDYPVESSRPLVSGAQIKAHLLMLRYKPLPGALVFTSTGSTDLVCYLPGAPDQRWFVTVPSRNELARVLSREYLRSYVMRRVTTAQKPYIKPLIEAGLSQSNVQLQPISHHLLEASYDTEALHAIHEADDQSTSTWESNLNTARETALTVIDVVSFVLPTKVLLPIALARFTYQIYQGVDALQRDEGQEALLHFMDSITHLTDGASDFAGSAVFGRSIRQRARQPAPTLSPGAASSHAATGLTLRRGDEYGSGIYEFSTTGAGSAHHYLKDRQGRLYPCRYDTLDERWRVIDERKPDARNRLPVREVSAGIWDVDPSTPLLKTGIERVIESARISSVNLDNHTPDTQGVYRVSHNRYIQQDGVVFEVYSGWLGRHWYLQLPAGSSSGVSGSYKLRRTAGYWEIKHRLADNTKRWSPLLGDRAHLPEAVPEVIHSPYDLPSEYKARVQDLVKNHKGLLDANWISPNPEITGTSQFFSNFRLRLLADARAFLATKPAKPRVTRPIVPANTSPQDLFKHLYEYTNGVVVGEVHSNQSGKKLLSTQMSKLAALDVKVLYLEHLQTDVHQTFLDDFFKTGKMPIVLDEFLKAQDAGHGINPASPHTYSTLVREARRHGIEVIAIDCAASYNHRGLHPEASGMAGSPADLIRYEMFSYFASQVIRAHQAKTGTRKWIALTGNTHANTFQGVPGLAELEGAIGVRVSDTFPGSSRGIRLNMGEVVPTDHTHRDFTFLKNDYWLQMEIAGTKPQIPALSPAQNNDRLTAPGMFRFESATPDGAHLIHRAGNHEMVHTPLQTDPDGQFYIERATWIPVHQKRYDRLQDLIHDLQDMNMTQMQ
ncbi:membrane-targeted effector domain-containing toxin [Pseudomonas fragi]|uniref:membrane-targeted effector domain-containing toxin n=1 Tax=Pseudomonas fragi TaxID=296 RepID=UPI001F423974|nr:membrane-targeted effector domain-containing toxin [Pseudomonas fragi]MCF6760611.1 membrane-targeted effector domain-containing toxin [Pseudomonas fragi]